MALIWYTLKSLARFQILTTFFFIILKEICLSELEKLAIKEKNNKKKELVNLGISGLEWKCSCFYITKPKLSPSKHIYLKSCFVNISDRVQFWKPIFSNDWKIETSICPFFPGRSGIAVRFISLKCWTCWIECKKYSISWTVYNISFLDL